MGLFGNDIKDGTLKKVYKALQATDKQFLAYDVSFDKATDKHRHARLYAGKGNTLIKLRKEILAILEEGIQTYKKEAGWEGNKAYQVNED